MRQGKFEKEIFIQSDPNTIIHLIADYTQYHKFHPLIENVERASEEPANVRRYFITDRLEWGPFTFHIKYRADILAITQNTIHTEAYQYPETYVINMTKVTSQGDGSLLHETITIKAPDLLFSYAFKQAERARDEMLKRIKIFIENR
jgi:ribosome-associated toxin RatA of RatAB toxin-antitoxin module